MGRGTGNEPGAGGGQRTALDTRITRRPQKTVKTQRKRARVSFRFEAVGSTRLECSVDAKPFAPCSSPAVFKVKTTGKAKHHSFRLRAVDPGGNPDPTPATAGFRVRKISS